MRVNWWLISRDIFDFNESLHTLNSELCKIVWIPNWINVAILQLITANSNKILLIILISAHVTIATHIIVSFEFTLQFFRVPSSKFVNWQNYATVTQNCE